MNLYDILSLKFPQATFLYDIQLSQSDDGSIYISGWNMEAPRPSQADLDAWALELDLAYRQKKAVEARQYPSVGAQLDMIYHDKMNDTDTWAEMIMAIKEAHPKPSK